MVFMIQIIKQEIEMEESLKQRLEFICQFCKTKPIFIKGITFLVFNYSTDIYIKNLTNKIQISELENYLNTMN